MGILIKRTIKFLSACSLLISSNFVFAGNPLFNSVTQLDQLPEQANNAINNIIRKRSVTMDFSLLTGASNAIKGPRYKTTSTVDDNQAITFNLFDDVQLEVFKEKIETSNSGNTQIWHGRIDQMDTGSVVIAITDNIAMGSIRTDDGKLYQIKFEIDGTHTIQLVDESLFPPVLEPITADNFTEGDTTTTEDESTAGDPQIVGDDGTIVDVMVVYTPSAKSAVGGATAMTTLINLAISETNTGLSNSGVAFRVNLVHAEEVSYTESGFSTDLGRLRSTSDGFIDNIHTLRDTHKADVVSMFINDSQYCGLGYLMTTPSVSFASSAFNVVAYNCATGYYSFGHEMGHNWGSHHDEVTAGGGQGAYSYSYGWRSPTRAFRTIMGYNCPSGGCTRVNYWSNPDKIYSSEVMGSTIGNSNEADNHASLNNVADIISNWRTGGSSTKATMSSPTDGSTLSATSAAFTWDDVGADEYSLYIGTSVGASNIFNSTYTGTSASVTDLPSDGSTLYVTLRTNKSGTWSSNAYTYTAYTQSVAAISSPTNGSTLSSSSVTFNWDDVGADGYSLLIGTSAGASDIFNNSYSVTSASVTGLPTNGSTLYVTLKTNANGAWYSNAYTYSTLSSSITSPTDGTTLSSSSASFTWNNTGADGYSIYVGTTAGAYNLFYSSYNNSTTSATVTGLPTDGSTVYVTFKANYSGSLVSKSYSYTTVSSGITSPTNGSTLANSSVTFSWNDIGADGYSLYVGTTVGAYDLFVSSYNSTTSSATVTGLPSNGSTIYVTLKTNSGSTWSSKAYTYTTASSGMTSPTNNSTFSSSSANFSWSDIGADSYTLFIGTTPGAYNLFYSNYTGTTTSASVTGLPTDGSTVYVTLKSKNGGTSNTNAYTYTAVSSSITSPTNNSTFSNSNSTFTWNNVGADGYSLYVGTSVGAYDLFFSSYNGTTTSASVTGLPTDGSTIYVTLKTNSGDTSNVNSYTYTAASISSGLTSPTNNSTLTNSSATFTWNNTGADGYSLYVGTSIGAYNISFSSYNSSTTSATINGLPTDGSTIYVTFKSNSSGTSSSNAYTYTTTSSGITSPTDNSTLTNSSTTFSWSDIGADSYALYIGTSAGTYNLFYSSYAGTTTSASVTGLPSNGSTIYVTLKTNSGGTTSSKAYTYTTASSGITSPTNNATLTSSAITFSWADIGADGYALYVGTSPGAYNLFYSTYAGTTTSDTVTGLPSNGSTIYVTLKTSINGNSTNTAYTYTTASSGITSPTNSSTLTSSSVTFNWSDTGADGYALYVGTSPGAYNLFYSTYAGTTTSAAITGLPSNGSTIYVTLKTNSGGITNSNAYTYTTVTSGMNSPLNNATLSGSSTTFSWKDVDADEYRLYVGTSPGSYNLFYNSYAGTTTSDTVTGLPTSGVTLYVTVKTRSGTKISTNAYTYTSGP